MKLKKYMDQRGFNNEQTAALLDVTSACIGCWLSGKSIPTLTNMRKIGLWSGGWVKHNDFYDEKESVK